MQRTQKRSHSLNKGIKKSGFKDLPVLVAVVGSVPGNSTQLLAIAAQGLGRELILQNKGEKQLYNGGFCSSEIYKANLMLVGIRGHCHGHHTFPAIVNISAQPSQSFDKQ